MEMPEGWRKLANDFNAERLAFAMQLMKEMAEALEDTCRSQPDKVNWVKANQVLDKFSEWK